MKHKISSQFLKESVSDAYAFFWEVYDGRPFISQKAVKRVFPFKSEQQLEKIDSKLPCLVLKGNRKRYYPPLRKSPVLHRTFCEITDDKDIIRFVSRYGFLGFTCFREIRKRDGMKTEVIFVESVARWKQELAVIKPFVHLWELVSTGNLPHLGALISRDDDGIHILMGRRKNLIADSRSVLARKWDLEGAQPLEAARQYLTDYINGKIRGGVFPRILPLYKKRIYLTPGNLLSAMWLMFLWEVIGEVRPHRCPVCGEWFDPKRSTRKTCGDRCRKKMSRSNIEAKEKLI
jgi:predicted nucleic acid-binding Zn ribbon protein